MREENELETTASSMVAGGGGEKKGLSLSGRGLVKERSGEGSCWRGMMIQADCLLHPSSEKKTEGRLKKPEAQFLTHPISGGRKCQDLEGEGKRIKANIRRA